MVFETLISDQYQTPLRMKGNDRIVIRFGEKVEFKANRET
jgi:hypothetical protein